MTEDSMSSQDEAVPETCGHEYELGGVGYTCERPAHDTGGYGPAFRHAARIDDHLEHGIGAVDDDERADLITWGEDEAGDGQDWEAAPGTVAEYAAAGRSETAPEPGTPASEQAGDWPAELASLIVSELAASYFRGRERDPRAAAADREATRRILAAGAPTAPQPAPGSASAAYHEYVERELNKSIDEAARLRRQLACTQHDRGQYRAALEWMAQFTDSGPDGPEFAEAARKALSSAATSTAEGSTP